MSTLNYTIQTLLEKMKNPDKDYRFMAANDLNVELQRGTFKVGADAEGKVVKAVLDLLDDTNGEVQNLAVKCLPSLIGKVKDEQIEVVIRQLCENMVAGQEQLRDVSIIGLKTTIQKLPVATPASATITTLLTQRLTAAIKQEGNDNVQMEALDIMGELLGRYGNTMGPSHQAIQDAMLAKLTHQRPAMRKRAIAAIGKLVPFETDSLFQALIQHMMDRLAASTQTQDIQTYVQGITAINRNVGHRVGRFLQGIFPILLAKAEVNNDELRENCLQAIESFVLRCPNEVGQYVPACIELGLKYLVYDPNYEDDEEEDEDADSMEVEDEEEDEEDAAGYSDDEDMSWKVRRASAKLLAAIISTRADLLPELYRTVAPRLVARFREREENVKVEVFGAFVALLRITKAVVQTKEPTDDAMDTGDSPQQLLVSLVPSLVKAVRTQLKEKSDRTRQGCFLVLRELVMVHHGLLGEHIGALVPGIKGSLEGGKAKTQLKIDCLAFLLQLLASHSPGVIQPQAGSLVAPVCETVNDSFYKIQAEALHVCTSLVKKLRPLPGPGHDQGDPNFNFKTHLELLYKTVMKRFQATDLDQEVKERAITCMSRIIAHMGDALGPHLAATLPHYLERLRNEITRTTAVRGLTLISESPLNIDLSPIFADVVKELASYLRKNNRVLRLASLKCVSSLVRRYPTALGNDLVALLTEELHPLVSDDDLQVAQSALVLNTHIIQGYPAAADSVKVGGPLLQRTLVLLESPLLQGGALQAVTDLMAAIITMPSSPVPFKQLYDLVSQAVYKGGDKGTGGSGMAVSKQAFTSISKTLAAITTKCPAEQPGVIMRCLADITNKKSTDSVRLLCLLTIGEIGSHVDLSANDNIKVVLDESLVSPSEDVKSGAAHALGHVCVGNLGAYLPFILGEIKSKPKRQYLLLHSLKEVICWQAASAEGVAKLRPYVEEMWTLLFDGCEIKDEGTRNVVAECLGKLVLVNPELLLPQLEARLSAKEAHVRSTVVTAVKFTISDQPQPIDRMLKPLMPHFLSRMQDDNLGVRRVALVTFNSAAHNKPSLIADLLEKLLPVLYGETVERAEYKREVQMGPFKHVIDDGLDIRKAAFECMYTLLDWCISLVPLDPFLTQVAAGLRDQYDIKMLNHLMLVRLAVLAPAAVLARMDELVKPLQETISKKDPQQAVKQEIEKNDELKRSAMRALVALKKIPEADQNPALAQLLAQIQGDEDLKQRWEAVQKDSEVMSRSMANTESMDLN
eukprot:comp24239_c0_seq1/m.44810 comp24239_c0_seq1/g.44810  ORF comp24239_c0_seq1/g.44810 comp24239_c0_seq1/m.44810 type:complete len:1254 (-) comp24239_c0_seq1:279-4040(-)